jgi:hypothetical protein
MLHRSEVRPEILAKPCAECGKPIGEKEDCVVTFYRGEFIVLHEECTEFIKRGGPKAA